MFYSTNNLYRHYNDSKAVIEYSKDIKNVYKNIEKHYPNRKRKLFIVFDDMISYILINKNLQQTVKYLEGRKLEVKN